MGRSPKSAILIRSTAAVTAETAKGTSLEEFHLQFVAGGLVRLCKHCASSPNTQQTQIMDMPKLTRMIFCDVKSSYQACGVEDGVRIKAAHSL